MRVSLENMRRWWQNDRGSNGNGKGEKHHPEGTKHHPEARMLPDTGKAENEKDTSHKNGDQEAACPSRKKHTPEQHVRIEPPWIARLDEAGIPRHLEYPSTTLGRLLDQAADRYGDHEALVYHQVHWTYRELLSRVNRLAAGLAALGVRTGDRVLMTLPNCLEFVTTFFAVQKLGAVVVNAGPLMGQDDLREAIHLSRPRVAVGLDLRAAHLLHAAEGQDEVEHFIWTSLQPYQNVFKQLGYQFKLWQQHRERNGNGDGNGTRHVGAHPAHHMTMNELLEHAASRPPTIAPDLDQTAVLQPTGGTTGSLKLAKLTHRSLLANCAQITTWMNLRQGQERTLVALPMFHVYGLTVGLLSAIYGAGKVVLTTRFDAVEALGILRTQKVTIFPLVPAICDALSDLLEKEEDSESLPNLRLCISGAAPLSKETAERFHCLTGAYVIEGYGLTEASPVTHAGVPGGPRVDGIGLPLPDTRCRVINPETGKDVEPGEAGEMLIAGPQVMAGYLSDAANTRISLQKDAGGTTWLHTGDIVRCDSRGFFHVLDRKKDLIIHAGLKIYPTRVEHVLRSHPAVKDVAVVGRKDPVHTENVVAVIVPAIPEKQKTPSPQDHQALIGELKTYCREHLSPYEVPAQIEFVAELPRSALGKLLRKNLREGPAAPNGEAANTATPSTPTNGKPHPSVSNGKETHA